jgi:Flp pilus assembly protein TadD
MSQSPHQNMLKSLDKPEALKEFQLAAQLTPDSPEVRFNYAALLNSIGQHADAENEYSKVIALDPESPTPYLKRGEV